jgi:hypothetical protein
MSDMYVGFQEIASDMLKEFGKPASLRKKTGGTFDSTLGQWIIAPTVTEHPVDVVEDEYNANEIDGTFVLVGDRKFLMTAVVTPSIGDDLVVGADTLSIVAPVIPLQPGSVAIMYTVNCRG